MTEIVIVRQNASFEMEVMAIDAESGDSHFQQVEQLQDVTPYGLFLSSLGTCTAIVLHTYAQKPQSSVARGRNSFGVSPLVSKGLPKLRGGQTLRRTY